MSQEEECSEWAAFVATGGDVATLTDFYLCYLDAFGLTCVTTVPTELFLGFTISTMHTCTIHWTRLKRYRCHLKESAISTTDAFLSTSRKRKKESEK